MTKELLMNEITDALGRKPTKEEFNKFLDEINEFGLDCKANGKKAFLVDISLLIYQYRDANYHQCSECDCWYEIGSDEWNTDEIDLVCRTCVPLQDPDMMPGGHDYY